MNRIDLDYIIRVRRELHQVPEIGYDLDETLKIIRRELDELGISYTEKYGISSIVATINEGVGNQTIALRADIDALPIQEQSGLPFSSKHPGKMHACGHDCHAAMLLGTAKALKKMEKEIKCCIKLIFQSAEEGPGGAKPICDSGLMDEVDTILACHVNTLKPAGLLHLNKTCMNASSHGFKIHLHGKSAHVARPQQGIDAIAMAARIYNDIQVMRARELDPFEPVVVGIGEIHGGAANNIICDNVMMHGTIRAMNTQVDEYVYRRITDICDSVTKELGASFEIETTKFYPCLFNDHKTVDKLVASAEKLYGAGCVAERPKSMGAEDFAYYSLLKPAAMVSLGVQPDDGRMIPLHNGKTVINEKALDVAPNLFVQYILDYME